MKVQWEFYSKRKGITLEEFLFGISTYEEAVEKFQTYMLTLPVELDLALYFVDLDSKKAKSKTSKSTRAKAVSTKKSASSKEKKSSKESKQYFRKVLKKET